MSSASRGKQRAPKPEIRLLGRDIEVRGTDLLLIGPHTVVPDEARRTRSEDGRVRSAEDYCIGGGRGMVGAEIRESEASKTATTVPWYTGAHAAYCATSPPT